MGEVYRAWDTKLNRDVALKVLPTLFALDPDRLARFTREAQLLATLNHPNIAAIYGLEESNGAQALVLELVDGPTLAQRIAEGPIPLVEALVLRGNSPMRWKPRTRRESFIETSSRRTSRSPAVAWSRCSTSGWPSLGRRPQSRLSGSPRLTATTWAPRTFLGTPTYMSPEQARCQSLDKRTDIWSFGCVFYEMLTGRAPFAGDTVSDTLAAILEREPDDTLLPDDTPLQIRRLLRRCLEKDRDDRLDSLAAARDESTMRSRLRSPKRAPSDSSRRAGPIVLATLALGTVLAAFVGWLRTPPAPRPADAPFPLRHRDRCRRTAQCVGRQSRPRLVARRPTCRVSLWRVRSPMAVR